MWAHVLTAAVGIWIMAAPSVLGYTGIAAHSDHIAGPLAATFAITAWWQCTRAMRWVNVVIGFWLLAAPWLLGFDATATKVNSMAIGALLVGLSLVKGKVDKRFGGGWLAIFQLYPEHMREAPSTSCKR